MRMCIPVKEFGLHLRRKDVGLYRRNAGRRDRMRQAPVSENEKYKRRNVKVLFFTYHLSTRTSDRDESLGSHSVLRCHTSTNEAVQQSINR